MSSRAIEQLETGTRTSFAKTITDNDIRMFAEVSGDHNPLHLDDAAAKRTIFGGRIAHGILSLGLVSAALAKLPGVTVYLSQTAKFLRPVRIGDNIEAIAEVVEKTPEKNEARLRTYCRNQDGETVLEGEARIKVLDYKE